jgi:hypothetical protein
VRRRSLRLVSKRARRGKGTCRWGWQTVADRQGFTTAMRPICGGPSLVPRPRATQMAPSGQGSCPHLSPFFHARPKIDAEAYLRPSNASNILSAGPRPATPECSFKPPLRRSSALPTVKWTSQCLSRAIGRLTLRKTRKSSRVVSGWTVASILLITVGLRNAKVSMSDTCRPRRRVATSPSIRHRALYRTPF